MSNSDPKYNIIEGEYLLDILDQPRALEATIEGLSAPDALLPIAGQLKQGTLKRIVLTGMGSSFHALYPLHLLLTSRGCATVWAETSELIHYLPQLLDPATLIIAVSQSGRSAEILSLLDKNAGRARIIAVTNTAESPLASGADALLLTNAGEEFSVSCKTYVTALLALSQVGALLGYADPRPIRQRTRASPTRGRNVPELLAGSRPGIGGRPGQRSIPVLCRAGNLARCRWNRSAHHQRVHPLPRRGNEQRRISAWPLGDGQ